jgi:protein-serine/threonine kinase
MAQLSPATPDIPDLLPPSPSVASQNQRFFAPTPSPLSSLPNPQPVTPNQPSQSLPLPSPSSVGQVNVQPPSPSFRMGPPIRPLDLGKLSASQDVYSELEQTVDEMRRWLGVVEMGLEDMLRLTSGTEEIEVEG